MVRLLLVLACAVLSMGATWYVAPGGDAGNSGTSYADAWTITKAIGSTTGASAGDTIRVRWGTYTYPEIPINVLPSVTLSGTWQPGGGAQDQLTWIIGETSPTGERPVMDGSAHFAGAAADTSAIRWISTSGNIREGWGMKGIDWLWPNRREGVTSITGAFRIENQVTTDSVSGYWFQDVHFLAPAPGDSSATPWFVYTASSDGTTDDQRITDVVILSCDVDNAGATPLLLRKVSRVVVEGCHWMRPFAWSQFAVEGPNAVEMQNGLASDVWIAGNHFEGFDHGLHLRGVAGVAWANVIRDMRDDFVWLHETDAAYPTDRWTIMDNLMAYGGDEGLEIDGSKHGVYANTFYGAGDWLLAFGNHGGGPPDSINVRFNIFAESRGSPESAGDRAITLVTGHTGLRIADNVWFDRDGPLTVLDADDGAITTIAELNATNYASNNVEADPLFADSIGAANLAVLSDSPARGRGMRGRIVAGAHGACADCLKLPFIVRGQYPDSLRAKLWDQRGRLIGEAEYATLHQADPGRRWLWYVDVDSSTVGRVLPQGYVHFPGRETPALTAETTIDVIPPTVFAAATDAVLLDDFAGVTAAANAPKTLTTGERATLADVVAPEVWATNLFGSAQSNSAKQYMQRLIDMWADWQAAGIGTDVGNSGALATLWTETWTYSLAARDSLIAARALIEALGDSLAAVEAAIIARGDDAWVTGIGGGGGGGQIGDGEFDHVIGVKSSADSAAVMGARVLLRLEADQSLFVDAHTRTTGFVSVLLDSAVTYRLRAFENGFFNPLVPDSLFTIDGGADTTLVYLDPIAFPVLDDPVNQVLMIFNAMLWTGSTTPIDSIRVEVRPKCSDCMVAGWFSPREWRTMGYTSAAGQLVFPLQRSHTISGAGGASLSRYEVRLSDMRSEADRVWTDRTVDNVLAPADSVTANVRWNFN